MAAKKILLVYPSSYDAQHRLIKSSRSWFPSRTLPYLAALTPQRFDVRIKDELVDDLTLEEEADLVAVTGMLRHMPRAIDIGRAFRRRGITTMIGGVGRFAIHDQIDSSGAFDCRVTGEVDQLWPRILDDFDRGRLKPSYECADPPDLKAMPPARFDLLDMDKYVKSFVDRKNPIMPIETGRGCPNNCSFCLVTRYFGKKMRYRPIGEVVEELKHHGARHVMFVDDNIAISPSRARELFLAIKPLGIRWLGQFESRAIRHPELLRLAAESGCSTAFVGVESLVEANLTSVEKSQNAKLDFQDIVQGFKEAGIPLLASMIFGMDHDTVEVMDWTVEQMMKHGVEILIPWILTPTPGTPLFDEMKAQGRLLHENYSLYDGWHVVFQSRQITPDDLEATFWKGLKRFYSLAPIVKRFFTEKRYRFSGLLANFYYRHVVHRHMHPFAASS